MSLIFVFFNSITFCKLFVIIPKLLTLFAEFHIFFSFLRLNTSYQPTCFGLSTVLHANIAMQSMVFL